MRTVTKEFTVYSVEDLRNMPELKEKVLEKYNDYNTIDNYWSNYTIEGWKEKLESYGFNSPEICFSGFWSQGDGASFTCKNIDMPVFFEKFGDAIYMEKQKKLLLALFREYDVFYFDVKRRTDHYYHENTVFVDCEDDLHNFNDYPRLQEFLGDAMKNIEDFIRAVVKDFSRQIYRELEKEYEYRTSEEALLESFEINELEFLKDGSIY